MESPGDMVEMQNLRPHLRHTVRIFIFMSSKVIQMHIKDGETFFLMHSFSLSSY